MSNELKLRKFAWVQGFRDATTKQLLARFDLETSYLTGGFGIPRSFVRYTMEDLEPKTEKQLLAINRLWEMFNTEPGARTMVITGGNGTGKSVIGCALVHTLARLSATVNAYDWSPLYVNEAELLTRLTGFDSGIFFSRITQSVRVLVIDEFAMTQWTPGDKRKIEQILNIRHGNGLKTIILTNRKPDELYGRAGGAEPIFSSQIRSRFLPGYNVELTGGDLRQGNSLDFDDDKDMPF